MMVDSEEDQKTHRPLPPKEVRTATVSVSLAIAGSNYRSAAVRICHSKGLFIEPLARGKGELVQPKEV